MLKVFALSTDNTVLRSSVPRPGELLMTQIRKLQENRVLTGSDFLEHSCKTSSVLVKFLLLSFFLPCPCRTESLPHTLVCQPLCPSTAVPREFDILISTCLNDEIEKAFTK